jgi:uncharacterized protein (DUF58 family)
LADALSLRRVYIFLTRHGFLLAAMLMVILLGSINYDNALGYMLAFLLSGLFLVAILHTYRNLAGLAFVGANAQPVFAGETADFDLVFDNRTQFDHLALLFSVAPPASRWPRAADRETVLELDFTGPGMTRGVLPVPTDRRGWLKLGRIRVSSTFPLGMLRAWAYFDEDAACLVYPRIKGDLPLPSTVTASASSISGTHVGSDDFIGLRPYALGDPPRAIAWKSLAKDQDIMVKRFVGGGETHVWLTWDATASLGDIESRLSQLTRWVVDADRIGVAYGLAIPGTKMPLGVGPAQREQCLRALALFRIDENQQ